MFKTSPLHDRHEALGANMTEFGGYLMPVSYGGQVEEHRAVRESVGVFDVSHLGKIVVRGTGALSELNQLVSNDLTRLVVGQAQYNLVCNEAGGIVDDLIVYRLDGDAFLLMPNAANSAAVLERIALTCPEPTTIEVRDDAVLAIQGPNSGQLVAKLGLPTPVAYMSFEPAFWRGTDLIVCRSGYTGELGYEIVAPAKIAEELWDEILSVGAEWNAIPAGLGARDTLRTEMGYPLHGHELSPDRLAIECGVSWAIAWDKPEFGGKDALVAARGAAQRISIGLKADGRWIPRTGMAVVDDNNEPIGTITSGTFSPTLGCGIALASVEKSAAPALGGKIRVQNRSRFDTFSRVKPPFVATKVRS